jgi:hypothetical protein
MGFQKLRVAPITETTPGVDGYPVYGSFIKLQAGASADELNAVEITVTPIKKTKTLSADDKEVMHEKDVRYEGTLKIFDIDADGISNILGYKKDANGNVIEQLNDSSKAKFCIFFQGESATGKKYQKYLYNVSFNPSNYVATTNSGEDTQSIELTFKGDDLYISGKQIRSATVYQGNTGWVESEPSTVYKEVTTP